MIRWNLVTVNDPVNSQGPVIQSTIKADLGLPVHLLLRFRLFWLNNFVQISQLETFLYTLNIC